MQRWLLRYARLWLNAAEARAELVVGRWAVRLLVGLAVGVAVGVALLLATAAFVAWKGPLWGWSFTLGLVAAVWLLVGVGTAYVLPRVLYRAFRLEEAAYRLRLARAGLRLLEEKLPPTEAPLAPLWQAAWPWLAKLLQRLLRSLIKKWLPFL
ncbi:MAG: hypothetical protein D6750_01270 [Bacteroidetes bacterium]|nr:MAG: hypothetical protein D6750_01270 [Bacteroidota bacterium]